jgi:hypothetical protein
MPVPDIVIEKLSELMSIARGMRAKRRLCERVGRFAGSPGGQGNVCAILGATEVGRVNRRAAGETTPRT